MIATARVAVNADRVDRRPCGTYGAPKRPAGPAETCHGVDQRTGAREPRRRCKSPDGAPLPKTGTLSDVVVSDGKVFFSITVDAAVVQAWEPVRKRAEEAVRARAGRAIRAWSR